MLIKKIYILQGNALGFSIGIIYLCSWNYALHTVVPSFRMMNIPVEND